MSTRNGLRLSVVAALLAFGSPAFGDLVHYWTFDTDATNAVPDGLDGTMVGSGVTITNVAGEYIRGSGGLKIAHDSSGGDYVHVEGPVIPTYNPTAFTIATWYRFDDSLGIQPTDGRNFLWETFPSWTSGTGLRDEAGSRDLEWYLQGSPSSIAELVGPIVNDNQWHHIAVVYDYPGGTANMYHDGVSYATAAANVLTQPTQGINIGNHRAGDGSRNWKGYLDDFAVFHGTLDDAGVAGLFDGTYTPQTVPVAEGPLPPDELPTGQPVAYWTFDDDYTSEVNNSIYEGVPYGGEFTSIANGAGEFIRGTGALKLDSGPSSGDMTYVDVQSEVADVERDKQITVSAWYNYTDISGDGSDGRNFVWESAPGYSLSFGLRDAAGTRDAEWWFQGITNDITGPEIVPGEWNHVVMILDQDAQRAQYYHNGELRDDLVIGSTPLPAMDGLHIGNHRAADGARDFDGYIDDVAVYHGVLTPESVKGLYDGTYTPLTVPVEDAFPAAPELPTGSPVAYWTFDSDYSSEMNNEFYEGTPVGGEFTSITTEAGEFVRGTGALKLDSGPSSGNITYVDVERPVADVERDQQITVSAWYNFTDISGDGSDGRNFIYESEPLWSLAFGLRDNGAVRDAEWWLYGLANDVSGPEITPGEWNHVVMVYDQEAGRAQYYHNGELRDDAPVGGTLPEMFGFHIGNHRSGDGARDFDGFIDDVAVYHGILSADAVAGLYDGTYTPLTVPVMDAMPEYPLAQVVEEGWTLARTIDFENPNGIALNPVDGKLYVGRRFGEVDGLYEIAEDGTIALVAPGANVSSVLVDPADGDVFFSEDFSGVIFRVAHGDTVSQPWITEFDNGDDDDPTGMAMVPDTYTASLVQPGQVVSVDRGSGGFEEVWVWSPDTAEDESVLVSDFDTADGSGSEFLDLADVAVSDTQIFVADWAANKIYEVVDIDAVSELTTSETIVGPRGVVFDSRNGDLLVLASDGRVVRVDPTTGEVSDVIDTLPSISGNWGYGSLGISPDGQSLFVSDTGANRVYVFSRPPSYLNSVASGLWDDAVTWHEGTLVPAADLDMTIGGHTVTVAADGAARSLLLADADSRLVVGAGSTLDIDEDVAVTGGRLEVQGTLNADFMEVLAGTLSVASGGTVSTAGDFELSDEAVLEVGLDAAGNAVIAPATDAYLAGTLEIRAVGKLQSVGDQTRTILTAAGESAINDSFDAEPDLGAHLGFGVFHQGVTYDESATEVTVFQAADGDANGDRQVDNADLQEILGAGSFGNAGDWDWTQGDFSGDGSVGNGDLQLILATGLFGAGPYAAAAPGTAGGSLINVPEPGSLVLLCGGLLGGLLATRRRRKAARG